MLLVYNDAILSSICVENVSDIQKELKKFMEVWGSSYRVINAI